MPDLDFPALASRLLTSAETLLVEWFPAGRRSGNEYVLGNLSGDPGSSLSINVTTGVWSDFSAGQRGGDLTSLYAAKLGITNGQAYRVLSDTYPNGNGPNGNGHRPPRAKRKAREVLSPVPADAPPCPCVDPQLGTPARIFTYRDSDGAITGYIARYEPTPETQHHYGGRNKQVKPWTYGRTGDKPPRWDRAGWPVPRPLYGLDDLAARPQAPVMVVEGEPAVEAARQFAASYVVVTWQAGTAGVEYADFAPLYGRSVLLWPDADAPGIEAMGKLAAKLLPHCPTVKQIATDGQPDGWDAADFMAENPGADWTMFAAWAKPRVSATQAAAVAVVHPAVHVMGPAAVSPAPVAPAAPASRKVNWYLWQLDCTGQGEPLANLNNAVTVLERDTQLEGLVWYDEFLNRILTSTAGSTTGSAAGTTGTESKPREWTDADDINLALDIQRRVGVTKVSIDTVSKAVVAVAMRNVKNCVRDWIDGLKWDGVARIDHFFEDHFGAERNAYTTAAAKNFWLSMLARVYRPGCKVDNVIVLEGAEGLGKSTVLQIVAGDWFTEQHESLMNPKAFFEVLQGHLLVEIGEMDAFNRAELTKVMAVITNRSDNYRESYGRHLVHHPRQGVFVCTTNEDSWNKSATGGRRWWPIRCGEVAVSSVAENRDQYFAEARARLAPDSGWNDKIWRFNMGEPWWIMPGDETRIEQAARYESDVWTPKIEEYLKGRTAVTIPELLEHAIGAKTIEMTHSNKLRVANALKHLRWQRLLERVEGRPMRIWRPPVD